MRAALLLQLCLKGVFPSCKDLSYSVYPNQSDKSFLKYVLIIGTNEVMFIKIISSNNISIDGLTMARILRHAIVVEQFDLILVGRASSDNSPDLLDQHYQPSWVDTSFVMFVVY